MRAGAIRSLCGSAPAANSTSSAGKGRRHGGIQQRRAPRMHRAHGSSAPASSRAAQILAWLAAAACVQGWWPRASRASTRACAGAGAGRRRRVVPVKLAAASNVLPGPARSRAALEQGGPAAIAEAGDAERRQAVRVQCFHVGAGIAQQRGDARSELRAAWCSGYCLGIGRARIGTVGDRVITRPGRPCQGPSRVAASNGRGSIRAALRADAARDQRSRRRSGRIAASTGRPRRSFPAGGSAAGRRPPAPCNARSTRRGGIQLGGQGGDIDRSGGIGERGQHRDLDGRRDHAVPPRAPARASRAPAGHAAAGAWARVCNTHAPAAPAVHRPQRDWRAWPRNRPGQASAMPPPSSSSTGTATRPLHAARSCRLPASARPAVRLRAPACQNGHCRHATSKAAAATLLSASTAPSRVRPACTQRQEGQRGRHDEGRPRERSTPRSRHGAAGAAVQQGDAERGRRLRQPASGPALPTSNQVPAASAMPASSHARP